MPQANNAPLATMTVDHTISQVEKMELVPTEAAASWVKVPSVECELSNANFVNSNESEEIDPAFAPDKVDSIMTDAESIGLKSMIVPSSPNAILSFPFYPEIGRHEPQAIIGRLIVQLMKPKRQLNENEQ